jgi:hypothetical protein
LPTYWIFTYGWYYLILYIVLIMIHLFFFYRFFCPNCSYSNTCPGGRTVHKLLRR